MKSRSIEFIRHRRQLSIYERCMMFYEEVFSRKESADERVKRNEWVQQRGDASLLNAKHYNGTSVAIDFGSSVAIMPALHARSVGSRTDSVRATTVTIVRTVCSHAEHPYVPVVQSGASSVNVCRIFYYGTASRFKPRPTVFAWLPYYVS